MIKLKEGQKVLAEDGSFYEIERGDILREGYKPNVTPLSSKELTIIGEKNGGSEWLASLAQDIYLGEMDWDELKYEDLEKNDEKIIKKLIGIIEDKLS